MINFWNRFHRGSTLNKRMVIKFNHIPNYARLLVRRLWDRDQWIWYIVISENSICETLTNVVSDFDTVIDYLKSICRYFR